jgi:predicted transcriptional regulator YdeE
MNNTLTPPTPLWIAGLGIRTNNTDAPHTIGALWGRYMSDAGCKQAQAAQGAAPDAPIYAVYCDFDRANPADGDIMTLGYRLVIGLPVAAEPDGDCGLDSVCIQPAIRHRFDVPRGQFDQVGPAWQRIWADGSLKRLFATDYERYDANGDIGIYISLT